ncbi:hypothetical protein HK097_001394 [Rhizophlyctis rosea]|uniref:Uncharacterized protein n=1 Tax=Rhizophlyctis rosea TaxID=64517 RepID=A0AAD5S4F4_9FUNG|nr:hypothetical protein HK097_001394 [Rhizophlyctis rosea]
MPIARPTASFLRVILPHPMPQHPTLSHVNVPHIRTFRSTPRLLHIPWTKEEARRLVELRTSGKNWDDIQTELPNRTVLALREKYFAKTHSANKKTGKWTGEEKQTLKQLYDSGIPVSEIAKKLNRTDDSVHKKINYMSATKAGCFTKADQIKIFAEVKRAAREDEPPRWNWLAEKTGFPPGRIFKFVNSYDKTKGPWEPEEEQRLLDAMEKYGLKYGWGKIAEEVGTRSPDQCSTVWHDRLDPQFKDLACDDWTEDLDRTFLELHHEGNLSIREIAHALGYKSGPFYRRFKTLKKRGLVKVREE